MAGAVIAAAILWTNRGAQGGRGGTVPEDAYAVLTGSIVLNGSVNGCGGEELRVSIREAPTVVASEISQSRVVGFDCVFPINLPVPRLDCYVLEVDGRFVGAYQRRSLDSSGFNLGVIDSQSVFGDPETGASARPDFNNCA